MGMEESEYLSIYCVGEGGIPNCKACKDNDHKNWAKCNISCETLNAELKDMHECGSGENCTECTEFEKCLQA